MKFPQHKIKKIMLTNSNSNVLFVENENNGVLTVKVYKSLKDYNDYIKSPTQKTTPDIFAVNVGDKVRKLLESTTSIPSGKTLDEAIVSIREKALLAQIKENVRSFPRTKFDVVNFA